AALGPVGQPRLVLGERDEAELDTDLQLSQFVGVGALGSRIGGAERVQSQPLDELQGRRAVQPPVRCRGREPRVLRGHQTSTTSRISTREISTTAVAMRGVMGSRGFPTMDTVDSALSTNQAMSTYWGQVIG